MNRLARLLLLALLTAALTIVLVVDDADARTVVASSCVGQTPTPIPVPPYTCETRVEVDGTVWHTAVNAPGDGMIHVTVNAETPHPVAVPFVLRTHVGFSSGPDVAEVSTTIPAGSTAPVTLSAPINCGQVDIKVIYMVRGDSRGRLAGPYINGCQTVTSIPATSVGTTPPTSFPPSTVPGASTTPGVPTTSQTLTGRLPATGRQVSPEFALAVAVFVAGILLYGAERLTRRFERRQVIRQETER